MSRNFKELQAKIDPERRGHTEQRVRDALKAMPSAPGPKDEMKQESLAPAGAQSHRG
jgi:hypothetical protein